MMRAAAALSLATSMVAGALHACASEPTRVADVYPTATSLPANLLRFYVYFSAPMGQGDILPSIDLLDEDGSPVEGVFLSNRYDLWSADRTRLTVLLDPGRVKTGLAANMSMGRALEVGRGYHLRIADTARDARGCPLSAPHVVSFRAMAADVTSPTPDAWEITTPVVGTTDLVTVALDGAVDHLSLAYRLRVLDPEGTPLAGHIRLDDAETRWLFAPTRPWDAGVYHLAIDPRLEDLAGNRIDSVFDLDLSVADRGARDATPRMIPIVPHHAETGAGVSQ